MPGKKYQNKTLQRAISGDPIVQRQLFAEYYGYVKSITLRYMSSREEADELLNDTFLKFFDTLRRYNPDRPLKTWLRTITINTCIDQLRRNKRMLKFVSLPGNIEQTHEYSNFEKPESPLLTLLQDLPPRYRAVFNLYVFEEHSHKEIAEILGISEGTSKSNYARAKKIIKRNLTRSVIENAKHNSAIVLQES